MYFRLNSARSLSFQSYLSSRRRTLGNKWFMGFGLYERSDRPPPNTAKRSLDRDTNCLKVLDAFIGNMSLEEIHMCTLQSYMASRKEDEIKSSTVSRELAMVWKTGFTMCHQTALNFPVKNLHVQ
jgi:hypothetical protein